NPALLFKGRGHRGSLKFSNHPAHTADVPAMLCRDLEACPDFCPPLSGLNAPPNRLRVHHYYQWSQDLPRIDWIPGLKTFTITGPVRSLDSWSRSGRPLLRADRPIAFIPGSDAEQYLDWGWSVLAPWGVWSVGEWASLSFS